ncbi:U4/U6.U5 snRNP associated protein [Microbotryomycetes sp. JL201]|nr:U4/U6.U5 snRNP associated protein [Microbotryomycetes sp. JL201]
MAGAYGANSKSDTNFRKEWNQEEYEQRARDKDKEAHERAVEAEEAMKQGTTACRKPKRKKEDLPKPTELMKARDAPLELDKNLNKTIIVNSGAGSGPGQPGFYCDVCKRTLKDSLRYLEHINGRSHLRRLGQTTKVAKSTLNDVRLKIAQLREQTAAATESKKYDFANRIKEIKQAEQKSKQDAKEAKRKMKQERQQQLQESASVEGAEPVDENMINMMGFATFGGATK